MARERCKVEVEDGSVVAGSRGRPVQRRKARTNAVTKEQLETFLAELAATCNVRGSARAAVIDASTVYRRRQRDPSFRERWDMALDQGYAGLEVALLEQAHRAVEGGVPVPERGTAVGAMDAKLAFALLQNYQKYRGREAGGAAIRRSDLNLSIERLEKALNRFTRPGKSVAEGKTKDGGTGQ